MTSLGRRLRSTLGASSWDAFRRALAGAAGALLTRIGRGASVSGEAVRESEARFRAVFDSDVVALVIWHIDGAIVDANEAYLRLFDLTPEEVGRGQVRWTELTPPEHRHDQRALAELASRGRLTPTEIEVIHRSGRRIPVLMGGSALPGHPDLGVCFLIDLSERKRAEAALAEQLALTKAIADNAAAALFMIDEHGRCTFMNPAAEAMTGFTLDELRARPLHDVIHHRPDGRPLPAAECPLLGALAERRPLLAHDDVFVRKDGELFAVVCAARPVVRDGSPASLVLEARDVTGQRRVEQQREMLLESERAARSEAERASRSRDEFVATLSHELRSPLNAVLGWAQLLQRPSRTPEQIDKGLETIGRNARVLSQIISDLLDVSRIAAGKLRLDATAVDLPAIIGAAMEDIRASAEAKGIELRAAFAPIAAVVVGDPARLQQVVWNLVSNAVKFTPRGGRVDVALAQNGNHVTIGVADTGAGIDPDFLPRLFERFRQADSSTARRHGGLGLGLSIVKHLVELHGGRVRAESAGIGRGARFVVELPVEATSGRRAGARAAEAPASWEAPCLAGKKVLVVDDEPDARDLVRRMLEECGAQVSTAGSALEAIQVLAREDADMLVSDIGMPGQDGYALIREIRAGVSGTKDVPAVALTAFARPEDRQRALEAGYQAHLAKPVEAPELLSTAARLVR